MFGALAIGIGISLVILANQGSGGASSPDHILMETGDDLLLEDNSLILLE